MFYGSYSGEPNAFWAFAGLLGFCFGIWKASESAKESITKFLEQNDVNHPQGKLNEYFGKQESSSNFVAEMQIQIKIIICLNLLSLVFSQLYTNGVIFFEIVYYSMEYSLVTGIIWFAKEKQLIHQVQFRPIREEL